MSGNDAASQHGEAGCDVEAQAPVGFAQRAFDGARLRGAGENEAGVAGALGERQEFSRAAGR